MPPTTPPPLTPGAIFVLVIIGLVVVTGTLMVIFRAWEWLAFRRSNMSTPPPVLRSREPVYTPEPVAPKPTSPSQFGPPVNWYASHAEPRIDLAAIEEADRDTVIDILSVLKKDGDYLLSANKIRDLVGGADAVVKSRVASHRPKPPAKKIEAHLDRPVKGW